MTLQLLHQGSQAARTQESFGGIIPFPLSLACGSKACRSPVVWWIEHETLGACFLSSTVVLPHCLALEKYLTSQCCVFVPLLHQKKEKYLVC